jgi:hypothetical protein
MITIPMITMTQIGKNKIKDFSYFTTFSFIEKPITYTNSTSNFDFLNIEIKKENVGYKKIIVKYPSF